MEQPTLALALAIPIGTISMHPQIWIPNRNALALIGHNRHCTKRRIHIDRTVNIAPHDLMDALQNTQEKKKISNKEN